MVAMLLVLKPPLLIERADWLVDRKRVPADWRKKNAAIVQRIAKLLPQLPKDVDPWLQTLAADGEAKFSRIRNGSSLTAVTFNISPL